MRCVGGPRFELAEWVPHVRAFCFVSTNLKILKAIGVLSILFLMFFASLHVKPCAFPMIRLNHAVLPIHFPCIM